MLLKILLLLLLTLTSVVVMKALNQRVEFREFQYLQLFLGLFLISTFGAFFTGTFLINYFKPDELVWRVLASVFMTLIFFEPIVRYLNRYESEIADFKAKKRAKKLEAG